MSIFKAVEIKTSMLFNLDFADNTILSCFFFFFLLIDIYFLIPAVIAQLFHTIAELAIPIGIPSKEAKTETEIHPVIVETKIRKCSIYFIGRNIRRKKFSRLKPTTKVLDFAEIYFRGCDNSSNFAGINFLGYEHS